MRLLQCSVDVPTLEKGSAAAQARPRVAGDTGLPWGFIQPFGSFQGALWCCGHTEARQNTVHAQPQASECRLDGAVPGSEVESQV